MILFAGGGRGPMSSFGNFIIFVCRCMVTNHGLLFFFSKVGVWNLKSKYINIDVHFCITKVKVFITLTILQQRVHASSSVCQCFCTAPKVPFRTPTCLIYLIVVIIYILLSIFSTGLPPH